MGQQDTVALGLPQYYRENFFTRDTMFYTEQSGHSYGVAGDPVPYTIRGDDLLSSLLLVCFAILIISIAQSQRFIVRQIKNIFYVPRNDTDISETSVELRFQLFLVVLSCLLMAIVTYQYVTHYVADTFIIESNLALMSIFFAIYMAYQVIKALLNMMVCSVFFSTYQNQQWMKMLLFINATEGVLLFPATMVLTYFDLSPQKGVYYFCIVLILAKILTFYKCWSIFFRQNDGIFQNILYFCSLEIVPLLNLAGGLIILIDNLKVTF